MYIECIKTQKINNNIINLTQSMEKYKSPYIRKHFRFLNDFYSNDYELIEKSSPLKSPITTSQYQSKTDIPSALLSVKKNPEGTLTSLTQVEEEDFYIEKRSIRKRDSMHKSSHHPFNETFHQSNIFKPLYHKTPSNDVIESGNSSDVYLNLLERIKRFNPKSQFIKPNVSKEEVLKIVENLIDNSSNSMKSSKIFRNDETKSFVAELQKNLQDIDINLSKVYLIPSKFQKKLKNKKNLSDYHLPGRYLCNIKLQNNDKYNKTDGKALKNSFRSLLVSPEFNIVNSVEDINKNFSLLKKSSFILPTNQPAINSFRIKTKTKENITNLTHIRNKTTNTTANNIESNEKNKQKFANMIRKMHIN